MWIELLNAHCLSLINWDYSIQSNICLLEFLVRPYFWLQWTHTHTVYSFGTVCAIWWPPELLKRDFMEGLSLQANKHCPLSQCQLMYAAPVPCLNLTLSRIHAGANLLRPNYGSMPKSMPCARRVVVPGSYQRLL